MTTYEHSMLVSLEEIKSRGDRAMAATHEIIRDMQRHAALVRGDIPLTVHEQKFRR